MAAPHVAGLAALIRQAAPTMPAFSVRRLILDTAQDKGATGWDTYWGHGLVNGFAALNQFFTTAKTDLRFVQNCNSPPPASWSSVNLVPDDTIIVEGMPNTIMANIHNNGPNPAVNFQVRLGVYGFSNGDLTYNLCTITVPGPLATGATMTVSCPWTPSATGSSGSLSSAVTASLRAEIVTPYDSDYANNCAHHNVSIMQTISFAHFRMRVINTTGQDINVSLLNDLNPNSGWMLGQSEQSFFMKTNDCPRPVNFTLTPDPGVMGRQPVNIRIIGTTTDNRQLDLGGVTIIGLR